MKIQYAVALALATGLGVGAVAMRGLQARATPPVYFVVEIDEITDASGFEDLRKQVHVTLWKSNTTTVATSRVQKI